MISIKNSTNWLGRAFFAISFATICLFNTQQSEAQIAQTPKAKANSKANTPNKKFDKSKLFVGGNMGLNFGSNSYYIEFSPLVGYRITPELSVGAGPSLEFYKFGDVNYNFLGGSAFARYNVWQNLFVHAEYEQLSAGNNIEDFRERFSRLPIGGGYSQPLGGNSRFNVMALYDVLYDPNSPYGDTTFNGFIIRAGVNIGL